LQGAFSNPERSPTGWPVTWPSGPLANGVGHLPNSVILRMLSNGLAE
jgi:hypothetical protein